MIKHITNTIIFLMGCILIGIGMSITHRGECLIALILVLGCMLVNAYLPE